ncbi:hypothetical protein JCM11251_005185 [Rhodosporidiobolus azoricus]
MAVLSPDTSSISAAAAAPQQEPSRQPEMDLAGLSSTAQMHEHSGAQTEEIEMQQEGEGAAMHLRGGCCISPFFR